MLREILSLRPGHQELLHPIQTESVWCLVFFSVCSRALQQRHWPSDLQNETSPKIKDTGQRRESQETFKPAALGHEVCDLAAFTAQFDEWGRLNARRKPSSHPVICVCRLTPPRWRLSSPGCPAPSDRSWPAWERAWRNAGTSAASRASRARRAHCQAPFKGQRH